LDLTNPEEKKVYDELLNSDQFGISFWLLSERDKDDKLTDRANTLQKLMDMSEEQLRSVMTSEEMQAVGIVGREPTKMELILAVIDNKKLIVK